MSGAHCPGLTRQRTKSARFKPGAAFHARTTLLAEGAHDSPSKSTIALYNLRACSEAQTYGLCLKELRRGSKERHTPGKVVHTIGWPLNWDTYGGRWEHHMADGLVSVGLAHGGRTLSEGGLQSLPQLHFPGEEGARRNAIAAASKPGETCHKLVRLKGRKSEGVAYLPERARVDARTSRLCARLTLDFAIQSRVKSSILECEAGFAADHL
ncbi:hypothetical protein DFH09DRAFT_1316449 [Mycena vulgaris]|nr:hypothetical protein DFH09DRAFT_1316449 [Mycena vulgaris]